MKKPSIMLEIRLPHIETNQDSQDAYNSLYNVTDISQRKSFYLWLDNLFQLQPGENYLDISCGHGQLVELASRKGAVAHGLDLSYVALQQGQLTTRADKLVTANSQQLPYADNTFDVVSNIGSLEHYSDMNIAIKDMTRVLRPGGRAYVLVPNTFSLMTNIWIAFRQGRTSIDQQPIQRYAARQEWQILLEEFGLVVKKTYKYEREWPRTYEDLFYYLRHPKAMIRLLLTPLIPLNLAFCFIFVAYKPKNYANN